LNRTQVANRLLDGAPQAVRSGEAVRLEVWPNGAVSFIIGAVWMILPRMVSERTRKMN
jgi:hypothetical protein